MSARHVRATGAGAAWLATVLLAGCAAPGTRLDWKYDHHLGCRLDEQALGRDTLYFGRAINGGGEVDDAAWQRYADEVLAVTFPQGYSVVAAQGRWRDAQGRLLSEGTRIVVAIHVDDLAADERVRAAIAHYRERFAQQSVLRERGNVCVTR
ncbi:MAG: DUF3574 domain-containing protein [Dokdonella sp.]|uniref:DUF3574 domain-containing protein n=1 Tax=Dokdonella sp. TaxID=2291710 RepID=UPI0025C08FCB|nr:DUF3574 domain-containing protein [Dokdonella sp.]MBX3701455.1 DUF3574 domain-containing protein [Dokdonella sp.]MCW5578032.1 DUF3574 domain-containing protein [Dokdonella sp.]